MARLPSPGGDVNTWGDILNNFLLVEHNTDGTLKASASLATKYAKPSGGIPRSDLAGNIQTALAKADAADQDASSSAKGRVQLAGDLAGTAASPAVRSRTASFTIGMAGSNCDYECTGTSDQITFQAAIDAVTASGGGTVLVRRGTYTVSTSIQLKANVALIGEGWNTIIRAANGMNSFPIRSTFSNNVSNVTIRDLKIDMNGPNQTANGHVAITGLVHFTFDHVWFYNSWKFALLMQANGDAALGDQCQYGIINNCRFDTKFFDTFDMAVIQGHYLRVTNNYFGNCSAGGSSNYALSAGRSLRYSVVSGNVFENCGMTAIGLEDIEDVVVANNIVIGGKNGIFITTFAGTAYQSKRVVCSNNVVKGVTNDGYNFGGANGKGSAIINDSLIVGNIASYCGRNGMSLYGAKDCSIVSNVCFNNNQLAFTATGLGAGIRFSGGNPQNNNLSSNRCYDDQAAFATYTTALTGTNNDLKFTAYAVGSSTVTITYVDPGSPGQTITATAVGTDITVALGTDGLGAITSTGSDVKAAIEATDDPHQLVTVELASGNDGTGTVTAMATQALTGGGLATQRYGLYSGNGDWFTMVGNTAYGNAVADFSVAGSNNVTGLNMGQGGLGITNNTTGSAISVRQNGTIGTVTSAHGAIFLENSNNTGLGFNAYTNNAAPLAPLFNIRAANAAYSQDVGLVTNAGTGNGLEITQSGTLAASKAGLAINWNSDNSNSGVSGLRVYSNFAHTQTNSGRAVANIINDNAASTAIAAYMQQDGTGNAVYVSNNGTGKGVFIDNNGTGRAVDIDHDASSASAVTGLWVNVANTGAGGAYAAIFEAGRVGINKTTPTTELDVSGTIATMAFTCSGAATFSGATTLSGNTRFGLANQTATATLTTTSSNYNTCNATSGSFTLTLPSTATPGIVFTFIKTDASTNAVTVKAGASGTINGSNTYLVASQYNCMTVVSTATADLWYVVDNN